MPVRNYLDYSPRLGERVYVDPAATLIGRVTAGEDCSFWPASVVRGDIHEIILGARTNVQDGCVLHVIHDGPHNPGGLGLYIGEDVSIGHGAVVHACRLHDRILVGMNATLLDGAQVESDVMIAAGSLVTPGSRLASGYLYMGSPAVASRELTAAEKDYLPYVAGYYVQIKDNYLSA